MLVIIVCASGVAGQTAQIVGSAVSCSRCSVKVTKVGSIGGSNSRDHLDGIPWIVTRLPGSRYLIKGQDSGGEMHLFARDGRWLGQLGRPGAGPGEFRDPMAAVVAEGDSLWIFDPANARITIFSPQLTPVWTLPVRSMEHAMLLGGNRVVISAQYRTPGAAGLPLHVLDGQAEPVLSFGSEDSVFRTVDFHVYRRTLARGAGQTIWAAHFQAFIIEQWDSRGRLVRRLVRDAEWFRPQVLPPFPQPDRPPQPKLVDIRYDSATDLLWVAVLVAGRDYRSAFGSKPVIIEGQRMYPVEKYPPLFDTVIEVIDVRSARVVATHRIEQMALRWTADGEIATYDEDARGNPRVDLWKVELQRPELR